MPRLVCWGHTGDSRASQLLWLPLQGEVSLLLDEEGHDTDWLLKVTFLKNGTCPPPPPHLSFLPSGLLPPYAEKAAAAGGW